MPVMRWAIATTITVTLVSMMATGAVAQSPSPEPPPWFGGRVAMPEHGFAVTVPDGWVAFDLAADLVRQVDATLERIDPSVSALDGLLMAVRGGLYDNTPLNLVMADVLTGQTCVVQAWSTPIVDFWDYAEFYHGGFVDRSVYSDIGPPVEVDIPAGPAFVIDYALLASGLRPSQFTADYWVNGDERSLQMPCVGYARPDDDWLSIVETIEFLPAE